MIFIFYFIFVDIDVFDSQILVSTWILYLVQTQYMRMMITYCPRVACMLISQQYQLPLNAQWS